MTLITKSYLREGLRLNVVESDCRGTPILFQHGLCGNAAQTAEAFPNDPRFKMITVEARGHGASEAGHASDFSIKTFADDVAAYANAENMTPCIMGGISMGAAMALHLAVKRPAMAKALVLVRPAWLTDANPPNMQPNAEIGELLQNVAPEAAKEKFLSGSTAQHLRHHAPDNLASLSSFFQREPIATTSSLLMAIAGDGPGVTRDELRALAIPTLIIATERDEIHPLAHAIALQHLIPQSQLIVITSKVIDRQRYVSEFSQALLNFFEENI
jgi:pimeloyl-ACP methyl ester carboxylesterase